MNDPETPFPSLAQIEAEALEEGREWTRRRLQQKLQEQADRAGRVFPPKPTADVARTGAPSAPAHQRRRR
jgi:hypothetical protein